MKVREQFHDCRTGESGFRMVEMPDVITPEQSDANAAAAEAAATAERTRRNGVKTDIASLAEGNSPTARLARALLELLDERAPVQAKGR